jgi:hypothetical protein
VHPQVRGPRQDTLCERQDALDVDLFELRGVTVDLRQRLLLAQPVFLTVVRIDVDRALVQEGLVEAVELLLNGLEPALDLSGARVGIVPQLAPGIDHALLHEAHVTRRRLERR